MTNAYTLVIFGLCWLLTISCHQTATSPVLAKAEALMEEHPDSATLLLEGIPTTEKLSEGNRALYYLLSTQADDKNYIEHTSDSLISLARNYYEEIDDSEHLMMSYYYLARVYQDLGDTMHAQEYYLKAIETGKNSANHRVLGRAYSNLGMIYILEYLFDTAKEFQLKAYDHYKMANDSSGQSFVLQNMARIHSMTPQLDSAIYYYEQALPLATEVDYYDMLSELSGIYGEKKQFKKAFEYIWQSINNTPCNDLSIRKTYILGKLYYNSGQLDSATYYLSQCKDNSNLGISAVAYFHLAQIEKQKQNWSLYSSYSNTYDLLRDSLEVAKSAEAMQRMQSMFDYRQVKKEKDYHELASDRKTITIYKLLVLSSILVCMCIGVIFFILERKRKIEKQKEQELRKKEQELYILKKRIQENEKTDSKTNISKQDRLITEFFETEICHLFYEKEKVTPENWEELIGRIEVIYSDFAYRLKSLYPTISVTELQICYLIKIHIPISQISKLLSLTTSGVSHSRRRLYTKLTGKDGSSKELDIFISDF